MKKKLPTREKYLDSLIIRTSHIFSLSRSKYSFTQLLYGWHLVQKTDTICINSPCANMMFFSVMAKILGKKLLIFHQGDLTLPRGIKNRMIERLFDLSFLVSCLLANKISTYTKDYAQHTRVMRLFFSKTHYIIPPFIPRLDKKSCQNEILRKLKKGKKKIYYVGFAGRFVEEKGFDILLRAIPSIRNKIPAIKFLFAGDLNITYENFFERNKFLLSKYKDTVIPVGLLGDTCLHKFFSMIDVLVVPSRSDCFPIVQAEAMIAGVPVVVSDIPGARVLVKETGFGKIFKSENENDLADQLTSLIKEKDKVRKNFVNVSKILNIEKSKKNVYDFFLL